MKRLTALLMVITIIFSFAGCSTSTNEEKAEKLTKTCEENNWQVISTKNDFKTIYGDGVKKDENNTKWLDKMLKEIQ